MHPQSIRIVITVNRFTVGGGIAMDDVNTYEQQRDRFLERLLRSARGTLETFTVYMGHRLGHYATLGENGCPSIAELADKTGTIMRPDTLKRHAADAGFCDVEILMIENFFFRFY
jgi:hypothetical protein